MKSSRLKLVALLATLALVLAVGAGSASAAPEEIAYGCGLDVCLIDPDNPAAVRNLTNNGNASIEEKPVWSPDGKRVAFISRIYANTKNVYVMVPDVPGAIGVAIQVTDYADSGNLQDIAWSPDGTKIAYTRGTSEPTYSVHVAAADGTTADPLLIAEHGRHPSWAPDGGKIAYSYGEQVYLRNSDASAAATPLANGAGHDPAWSPDGTSIAFDGINPVQKDPFVDLHIANSTGAGTPLLVTPNYSQWSFVTWAPGGSKLAYRSTQSNAGYVRVVDRTGAGDHALASGNVGVSLPASWSPDGSRIVTYGYTGSNGIYLVNTDGSGAITLLTGVEYAQAPSWRPNPLITPFVPVVTPSGGSNAPLPKTQNPKLVWIKTGLPWKPSAGYIQPLIVFCAAKDCGVNSTGYAKASKARGLTFRPLALASPSAKKKAAKVLVASGKMKIPAGKSKPVKLRVTKQGAALIKAEGEIKLAITVTISAPGQKKIVKRKTVRVYLATKK